MNLYINVKAIQKARIEKGYSQRELSRRAGLSSLSVNYLEQKKTIPRPSTIKKICDVLDLDINQICKIN